MFTDRDGLVVFEQAGGLLGTADPDGGHPLILKGLGPLQGNDLPVASAGSHFLVSQEGQLVTMGARGPVSVTDLPGGEAEQPSADPWSDVSFADGDRYVAATECDFAVSTGAIGVAYLLPTASGKQARLKAATASAGDPASAGALLSVPAGGAPPSCDGQPPPDQAIDLGVVDQATRTVITSAVLLHALGWPASTPVWLSASPDPDGSALVVSVTQATAVPASPGAAGTLPAQSAQFLVSRAGRIITQLRSPAGAYLLAWSPDGKQIAACSASAGQQTTVSVLAASGGAVRTIGLPGHHDQACGQLLWSPDDSQLMYSGVRNFKGLTEADRVQHGWTVIDLRTGAAHDVTASGQPVAWLPAAGAASKATP